METVLKTSRDIDLQQLMAYLAAAQRTVGALQEEMDGRLSKAITMLSNSRDEMRAMLGRISTGLAALQLGTGGTPEPPALSAADPEP